MQNLHGVFKNGTVGINIKKAPPGWEALINFYSREI